MKTEVLLVIDGLSIIFNKLPFSPIGTSSFDWTRYMLLVKLRCWVNGWHRSDAASILPDHHFLTPTRIKAQRDVASGRGRLIVIRALPTGAEQPK